MNRNKTVSFCLFVACCSHTTYAPQLILSCDSFGGCLLPHVGCSVFTGEDHAAAPAHSVFLAHSRCSVNLAPWKELGLCR